jgi:branched-chain amino acid transport system ATP-binding protein
MGALFLKTEADFKGIWEKSIAFSQLLKRENLSWPVHSAVANRMLAIARAMMGNPKIMILDEPSLGLAPLVVAEVFDSISKINRNGTTILLVEQNANKTFKLLPGDMSYRRERSS